MDKIDHKELSHIYKVGDHIQRALDKRGKTQVWLTEEMTKLAKSKGLTTSEGEEKEYDKTHINRWCNNRNVPSLSNMEMIADIVGYTVEELVTGKFEDEKEAKGSIDLDDPIINNEIEQILDYVESACKASDVGNKQIEKYKTLIKGKVKTLIEYVAG